ncbi:integrase, partial [Salmonella enterica subsp. enterica serovar Newport]
MSQPARIKKMPLSAALIKYYDTVSVHKRGHQQEFWRVSVIKRHPVAQKMMD